MPSCDRCDRWFSTWPSYFQHMRTSPQHNYCDACNADFHSPIGLKEHWVQSPHHDYCQYCNAHFSSSRDLEDHMDTKHDRCVPCRAVLKNPQGLHEHYRQSIAHSSQYCVSCRRLFQSLANFKSHMNSSIHRSKDYVCPGYDCGLKFVSQSAVVLHLESGKCTSGANRSIVNKYVRQHDTNNVITDPSRLLTNGGADTKYYATSMAWNGNAYECYLCHGKYPNLKALNQHLGSSRHESKIYICPLSSCKERFSTLSGLCQHIESERCGVLRFPVVQRSLDNIVGGMKRLTMG